MIRWDAITTMTPSLRSLNAVHSRSAGGGSHRIQKTMPSGSAYGKNTKTEKKDDLFAFSHELIVQQDFRMIA
jgi:hypothetical protein